MDERLFQVILTLIPVLGAIITYYIVPLLKEKASAAMLEKFTKWADVAVQAAEMIWKESGSGKNKKEYCVQFLNKLINSKKEILTLSQIDALIESSVQSLKIAKKE